MGGRKSMSGTSGNESLGCSSISFSSAGFLFIFSSSFVGISFTSVSLFMISVDDSSSFERGTSSGSGTSDASFSVSVASAGLSFASPSTAEVGAELLSSDMMAMMMMIKSCTTRRSE